MKLEWGHFAEKATVEDGALVSLEGIMEFFTLPPAIDGVLVTGFLALMFSTHPADDAEHQLRVDLTHSDREVMGSLGGTIRCFSLVPGATRYGPAIIPVTDVFLPVGESAFRVYVDGDQKGTVILSILHVAVLGSEIA